MALIGANKTQKEQIFQEINETHENKLEENKELIKQWISMQPHLPKNYDEKILDSIVRGCKHDMERVKRKVDCYFTYRSIMPEFFTQRDPTSTELRSVRKSMYIFPLPKLTPSGCRVTYHAYRKGDPSEFDPKLISKYSLMVGDIRVLEEGPISGDIFVFDVGHMQPAMLARLINPTFKKAVMCAQSALPQRLKEVHIINAPSYVDTTVNLFKMFVKPKIRERFQTHLTSATLFEHIPAEVLPSDIGGLEKSVSSLQDEWDKKMESYKSYMEEQENIKTDESKRLTNNQNASSNSQLEMFGTVGSFHKLNID